MIKIRREAYSDQYLITYSNGLPSLIEHTDLNGSVNLSSAISCNNQSSTLIYNVTDNQGLPAYTDSIQLNRSGKIQNIYNYQGTIENYYYNNSGQLDSIITNSGKKKIFTYSNNKLSSYYYYNDSFVNGTVYFQYNENNQLIKESKIPNGMLDSQKWEYVYDSEGYLDTAKYIEGGGWINTPYPFHQCGDMLIPEMDRVDIFVNPNYRLSATVSIGFRVAAF